MNKVDVRGGTYEGQGDKVHAELEGEPQVTDVLLAQCGNGDAHPGQGHTLVIGDGAAFDDLADDIVALDLFTDKADLAVVDKQTIAGASVLGQPLVGGGHAVVRAFHIINCDGDDLAVVPHRSAINKAPEADLRPLQISKDADGLARLIARLTGPVVVLYMILVIAMGEVQPGDVHTSFNKSLDAFLGGNSGTERTHDLSSSLHA